MMTITSQWYLNYILIKILLTWWSLNKKVFSAAEVFKTIKYLDWFYYIAQFRATSNIFLYQNIRERNREQFCEHKRCLFYKERQRERVTTLVYWLQRSQGIIESNILSFYLYLSIFSPNSSTGGKITVGPA